ncbi:hypothetical protein [Nocardia lasii]|uniref:Uncharacterized protein n=1 Tax=Nocardia lasii TaxID=1616107 RepID=A0ABW1JTU8_9NOCA
MGDFFERIVDLEVSAADAGAAAERMLEWMAARGWVLRETSAEGVYTRGVTEGFVAGPAGAEIADDWGADWISGPVAVVLGRRAHHPGQGEVEPSGAVCPSCRATTVIIDYPQAWEADPVVWQPFSEAVEEWERTGAGAVRCGRCATVSPVTDWAWTDGYALGALSFDFWGWPPLSDAFVAEFVARLGHRIEHHSGKA